jgi:hypothetical protein
VTVAMLYDEAAVYERKYQLPLASEPQVGMRAAARFPFLSFLTDRPLFGLLSFCLALSLDLTLRLDLTSLMSPLYLLRALRSAYATQHITAFFTNILYEIIRKRYSMIDGRNTVDTMP